MKDLFLSYSLSLIAKQKGFDEPCFGYYKPIKPWMMKGTHVNSEPHFHGCNWPNDDNTFYFMYVQNSFGDRDSTTQNSKFTKATENIAVPLYQQITDWFRIRGIDIVIERVYGSVSYSGKVIQKGVNGGSFSGAFVNYYDTLNKAIEEAFKLI